MTTDADYLRETAERLKWIGFPTPDIIRLKEIADRVDRTAILVGDLVKLAEGRRC